MVLPPPLIPKAYLAADLGVPGAAAAARALTPNTLAAEEEDTAGAAAAAVSPRFRMAGGNNRGNIYEGGCEIAHCVGSKNKRIFLG